MGEIRLSDIDTEMYNPFGAIAEELLAAALDESGILRPTTTINGNDAGSYLQSYYSKRAQYQEVSKLGSLLVRRGVLKEEELAEALTHHRSHPGMKLGEAMVQLGICSVGEIEDSLDAQISIREGMKNIEEFRQRINSIKDRLHKFF